MSLLCGRCEFLSLHRGCCELLSLYLSRLPWIAPISGSSPIPQPEPGLQLSAFQKNPLMCGDETKSAEFRRNAQKAVEPELGRAIQLGIEDYRGFRPWPRPTEQELRYHRLSGLRTDMALVQEVWNARVRPTESGLSGGRRAGGGRRFRGPWGGGSGRRGSGGSRGRRQLGAVAVTWAEKFPSDSGF